MADAGVLYVDEDLIWARGGDGDFLVDGGWGRGMLVVVVKT